MRCAYGWSSSSSQTPSLGRRHKNNITKKGDKEAKAKAGLVLVAVAARWWGGPSGFDQGQDRGANHPKGARGAGKQHHGTPTGGNSSTMVAWVGWWGPVCAVLGERK